MSDGLQQFMEDTDKGLSQKNKSLLSKYFYDEKGSHLFTQITQHPSYYLTGCEIEILESNKSDITRRMGNTSFNLLELGPGEGIKSKILINHFLQEKLDFRYIPIDISQKYLHDIQNKLQTEIPDLSIEPIKADYFRGLKWQSDHSDKRNLVLFLGSSIGNFNPSATITFLTELRNSLHVGDYVLLGFDLIKDIQVLLDAYNDNKGLTRAFNFNHLIRINRELGGDFNINNYAHRPAFNRRNSAMESYLVSNHKHIVNITKLNKSFSFDENEVINMEYSHKYDPEMIANYAEVCGFKIAANYTDKKNYFLDSLWQVK